MSLLRRIARVQPFDLETLAIVLTASLLEWLRVLPTHRAQHMVKLTAGLLRDYKEEVWSARLEALGVRLRLAHESGSGSAVVQTMEAILQCFGGMGSLGDLYLSPANGHKLKPEQMDEVNTRLGALRTQLYLSARQTIARIEWQQREHLA